MTDAAPYKVPKEPGRWRAITLAAVVHAALFALLWFGVRWQNETPLAVEAEVWSPHQREAAPRPQPEPEPEIKPVPKPEPKPVVKPLPKPQVVEPPVVKAPDIALEREKKRKADERKRLEEERLEKLAQKAAEQKAELKAEQKTEEKRLEKEKADAVKQKAAAENAKKIAADKQRKLQAEADTRASEQRRQEDIARMKSQAGSGGSGEAPKAQGGRADSSYIQRVGAKIKSNTVFDVPDELAGNPAVDYAVELLPDGSLRGLRKLKSSGVPGFDEAVKRAIERSVPYPPDKSGIAPSGFTLSHKPKDQ